MDLQRPLFWSQGLFLQPHHFQLTDLYCQSLLLPLHRFLVPHFWGIAKLEISETALANLTFNVTQGEFLFPDGSFAVYPGNSVLQGRSFETAWQEKDKPFTIFLGLKKMDYAGENVAVVPSLDAAASSTGKRFITAADSEEVADLHQAGQPGQVQRLSYVLRLFWETEQEQAGDYTLLPIAQMEKDGEDIKLAADFIPPTLTIQSSAPLYRIIKEIKDQTASRSRQLEEFKTQRGIHSSQFGARDMVFLLALRSLNRYVPQLFHLTEAPNTHPWTVYGLLRQLIGELSSFSAGVNVLGTQADGRVLTGSYDHRDLRKCFLAAQSLITRLLDEITAGPEYVLELIYDGTYYAAELQPAMFEGRNRFYLVITTEADPKIVVDSLQGIAKLGSRESLPIRIARALPGIGLQHLADPPQELPRRPQCVYFQIDHHSEQWSDVQQGKNIALYWDAAPEDFKVELMIAGRS